MKAYCVKMQIITLSTIVDYNGVLIYVKRIIILLQCYHIEHTIKDHVKDK